MLVIQRFMKQLIGLILLLLPMCALMATQPSNWIVDETAILPHQACQRLNIKLMDWEKEHTHAIAVLVMSHFDPSLDEDGLEKLLEHKFNQQTIESSKKIIYLVVDAKNYRGWIVSRCSEDSTVLLLHKVNQEVLIPALHDKQVYKAVWETVTALMTCYDDGLQLPSALHQRAYHGTQWFECNPIQYFLKAIKYVLLFSLSVFAFSRFRCWWYSR